MTKKVAKRILLGGAACGAMLMGSGLAHAQDAAEDDENIIIVTAKGVEQNLQEVPLSITTFDTEELEARGIDDVNELADFTPNFNVGSSTGRQDATAINVRGLGANTSDERYQPVSFFLDGIFIGGVTVGLQTVDVARIEVIKGPQSATYGRATYAGAIDFISKTPSLTDFGGSFNAQVSSNTFDNFNYVVGGQIEVPLIEDKLAASVFVQRTHDDGFPEAIGSPIAEAGQEKTTTVNGLIYFEPTPSTSIKLRAIYSKEEDQSPLNHTQHLAYWDLTNSNIVALDNGGFWIDGALPNSIRDNIVGTDLPTLANCVADPCTGGFDRERFFVSAVVEHEFDNGMSASYRGSYLHNSYDGNRDFFPRTLVGTDPIFGNTQPLRNGESNFSFAFPFPFQEEFEETSHQIRLLSSQDQAFRWSVGGYYYTGADRNFQARSDRTPSPENPSRQTRGTERITNYAAFGSLAYDLTDQLSVGFEGRIQKEKVEFARLASAASTSSIPETDLSSSNTSFEPRVTIDYQATPDQLFYALYSKGVKSGRYNTTGGVRFPAGDPRGADNSRPNEGFVFAPPEQLHNFEIGSKTTFADGRGTLNLAAFYQIVKDQQLRTSVEINGDFNGDGQNDQVNQIFTAGDSEIYGFEIEAAMQFTDAFSMRAAMGYARHEFQDDVTPGGDLALFRFQGDAAGAETLRGRTQPGVPRFTANVSGLLEEPVSDSLTASFRADVIYTGRRFADGANLAYVPSNFKINTRSTIRGDKWTASIFIKNLLDDRTVNGTTLSTSSSCNFRRAAARFGPGALTGAQRCPFTSPERGLEIGASVGFDF